ncbi:MAG: type II toxin-antitoxin system PemK/MazF family toxin [Halodesulfurarchaeum sp.]
MRKYPSGTITWAQDPTGTHPERPVVVISHADRPYNSVECTVVCLGTNGDQYDHQTPELTDNHCIGITFGSQTYLLPWAIYTIAPSSLLQGKPIGQLSKEGEKLVAESLYKLVRAG